MANKKSRGHTVYHVVSQGELMQYHTELTDGTPEQQIRPLLHPVDTYQQAMSRFMKTHFADLTADVKGAWLALT